MKNSNEMTKLRNKIVLCFVIVVFAVRVMDSAIDSVWDAIIVPKIYPDEGYTGIFAAGTIGYMGASFVLYLMSAIVFYIMVKKIVEKESLRQVQKQNLIYASIAHDIKTPMTSVQGFAKALSEGKIKPDETQEIYEIIYNKSKSMNELVDIVFEYAKCGTNDYQMMLEEIDLCVLVRDIVAEHYCDFEDHHMDLEIDIPENPIIINADKKEMKRALANLVNNTYKHNPEGIKVLVRLAADGKNVKLIIADSGKQIDKNMNIFEPFVTENISRTTGNGNGLGLAITKRILDKHDARISIADDISGYTKAFVVFFARKEK